MQFGFSLKGWTVIDVGGAPSLCAVSVKTGARGGERPRVTAMAHIDASGSDTDGLRELVGRVDRSLPVLMTLPRSHYRLRVMPEPAVPAREMLTSLRWSLGAESDGPVDELNLAWMRIPTEEQLPARPKRLYAVTTSKAELAERLTTWRQAGVKPKVVDIRETALRNIAGALERPGEGLVLVSADTGGVGMVFTHQGSLYLDRYIEQPLAELRAADPETREGMYQRIAQQLLRSIDVVGRSYPFMPVTRVVVAPSPEALGLFEALAAQLPLPVEALDLGKIFDLSRVPALAQSPALQARCLVPLGAALRGAKVAA